MDASLTDTGPTAGLEPLETAASVAQAAPGLAEEFRLLLEFVRVEEVSLTCGEAVFSARERIVENISTDEGWSRLAGKAKEFKLAACWSFPVLGAKGRIVGTLDVYLDQARKPTPLRQRKKGAPGEGSLTPPFKLGQRRELDRGASQLTLHYCRVSAACQGLWTSFFSPLFRRDITPVKK